MSGYKLFNDDQISNESIFVNKWLNILKPAYENISNNGNQFNEGCIVDLERSEEHTSELQSRTNLVCRLLLEKKKKQEKKKKKKKKKKTEDTT